MKNFIIKLSKVFPWIYIVLGIVLVIANPPRTKLDDENAPLVIGLIVAIILSGLLFYGFSYIIEAACLYLDEKKKKEENHNYTIDGLFQKLKTSNIIGDSKESIMNSLETIGIYTNDKNWYRYLRLKIEDWKKDELHTK